ncbi:EpsG family protein [Vagococcus fluvialis]|uniref:EpsG family protein n=1 Tax=Vagococcus fluvialis TaxID=2738 RepID=UPI0032E4294C
MSFYITLLFAVIIISIFFSLIESKIGEKIQLPYLIIVFVIIFMISAIRSDNVGSDTINYKQIFMNIGNYGFESPFFKKFPIYSFYNLLLFKISSNFLIVNIVNGAIIYSLLLFSIKKLSVNIYLSNVLFVLLYCYFDTFNITRQYISISLLLLSFFLFISKKKKWIFTFVSSILIHASAVIGATYVVFYKINWNVKRYFLLSILSFIFFINMERLLRIFYKIFPMYKVYSSENNAQISIVTSGNANKLVLYVFYLIFIILGIMIVNYNLDKNNKIFRTQLAIVLFSIIPSFMFPNNILLERTLVILNINYIFVIPGVIKYFSKIFKEYSVSKRIFEIVVCIALLIPFYFQLNNNNGRIIPYKTIYKTELQ